MEKILAPHQQIRIKVLLALKTILPGQVITPYNPNCHRFWRVDQRVFKRYANQVDFVPAQSTDYIFCTIGEEWGFMGTFLMVLALLLVGSSG